MKKHKQKQQQGEMKMWLDEVPGDELAKATGGYYALSPVEQVSGGVWNVAIGPKQDDPLSYGLETWILY